jgi:mono/diheme cytochrome c family protein
MDAVGSQRPKSADIRRSDAYAWVLRALISFLFLVSSAASLVAAAPVDYEKQIKPIFTARCKACHGVLKQEAGLRLDTGALVRQGGDSGKVIDPGKSATSELLARITSTDDSDRMPQEGEPLTAEQIAVIRDWIDQGANSPAEEKAEQDPREH